jgi:hypothetical protein
MITTHPAKSQIRFRCQTCLASFEPFGKGHDNALCFRCLNRKRKTEREQQRQNPQTPETAFAQGLSNHRAYRKPSGAPNWSFKKAAT